MATCGAILAAMLYVLLLWHPIVIPVKCTHGVDLLVASLGCRVHRSPVPIICPNGVRNSPYRYYRIAGLISHEIRVFVSLSDDN